MLQCLRGVDNASLLFARLFFMDNNPNVSGRTIPEKISFFKGKGASREMQ